MRTKLKVGAAHDIYEREADRVAARIVSIPESSLPAWSDQPYPGTNIQRRRDSGGAASDGYGDIKLSYSGGSQLSPQTRRFMEPRFGVEFGHVQLHRDREAQATAARINARAFTYGSDIWLGKGESEQDRSLMAHELTHVVQQSPGSRTGSPIVNSLRMSERGEIYGREAGTPPKQVVAGRPVQVSATAPAARLQMDGPASSGQVCGGVDNFFRTILLIDPNIVSDEITCLCLGFGIADILPIPAVGGNPVVEFFDCACNVLTTLQEIYNRGSDGGCWSIVNLSTIDILLITALIEATIIDCGSLPIGTALGAFLGGLFGGGAGGPPGAAGGAVAGGAAGAVIGDFIVDVAAMAAQNLITQGTPLPAAQAAACGRLITPPRPSAPGDFPSTPGGRRSA